MKLNILNPTPKNIRALKCPPGKKQSYERISKDLHLYVSTTPGGSKSFVYRRYLNNTYRELHLGLKFADSLDDAMAREVIKEAESKAAELHARINRGENPFDEAVTAKQDPTLRELFDAYMERHIKKSRKRPGDIENDFKRWLLKLANRKATSITRHEADKLHGELSKNRGPYSANRAIQLARAIFNKARTWKLYLGDNPFADISLYDEYPRNRFLSEKEAGKLLQALQLIPDGNSDLETLRDIILLACFIGARKDNLMSMRFDELDLSAFTWTIPAHKTKNKFEQLIPLGNAELNILNNRKQLLKRAGIISPYVFPGSGKNGHLTDFKKSWTTLRRQIGLEDVTVHDLRRSLAAGMASQNVNTALIKGALNHADIKTTIKHYAKTSKQAELEARQLVQNAWFKAAESLEDSDSTSLVELPSTKTKTG